MLSKNVDVLVKRNRLDPLNDSLSAADRSVATSLKSVTANPGSNRPVGPISVPALSAGYGCLLRKLSGSR